MPVSAPESPGEVPILELEEFGGPSIPDCSMEDGDVESMEVEYSSRAPEDWVSSGPLGLNQGRGRRFRDVESATRWARQFYGKRLKGIVPEAQRDGAGRWAFLIKGPRGDVN